ncbi:MAG: hypothetical protein KatS3mg107_1226 [Gemmataceae bacterium]|nr:MAG: hypothetical protein KatS3mg107_1226 [Gemmataceae bacterium]
MLTNRVTGGIVRQYLIGLWLQLSRPSSHDESPNVDSPSSSFGRIVEQRWLRSGDGTAVERLQYTYDRNGNRLSRLNLLNAELSESYSYDNLNQLISFMRGDHSRSWDYDAQGNWQSVVTNGNVQTRTHNAQNEITSISGAVLPTYDANGNLTRDETGRQFVYDAWNRLVEVKDAAGATLKSYAYDGRHRRVQETAGGTATDLFTPTSGRCWRSEWAARRRCSTSGVRCMWMR